MKNLIYDVTLNDKLPESNKLGDKNMNNTVFVYTIISLFIFIPVIIVKYAKLAGVSGFTMITDVIWYYGTLITFKYITWKD